MSTFQDEAMKRAWAAGRGLVEDRGRRCIGRIVWPGHRCHYGGNQCCPRLPDEDHATIWRSREGGRPTVFVSQPYDHWRFRAESAALFALQHGLKIEVHEPESGEGWYNPGNVCLVVVTKDETRWQNQNLRPEERKLLTAFHQEWHLSPAGCSWQAVPVLGDDGRLDALHVRRVTDYGRRARAGGYTLSSSIAAGPRTWPRWNEMQYLDEFLDLPVADNRPALTDQLAMMRSLSSWPRRSWQWNGCPSEYSLERSESGVRQ